MERIPSVKSLLRIPGMSAEKARQIRAILTDPSYLRPYMHESHTIAARLKACNEILGTYGVEGCLGRNSRSPDFYYCNAGDPYVLTLMHVGRSYRVGTVGDIVERGWEERK